MYDLAGRLAKIKDSTGKKAFEYDKNNNFSNITEFITPTDYQTSYEYDGDNSLQM